MSQAEQTEAKWDVQLRKGSLELVILAALKERELYGLELLNLLHSLETMQITEGTLYPLMDRLKRDGVVAAEWQQEGDARPRKYYKLTKSGADKLKSLTVRWRKSVGDIEFLLRSPGPEPLDDVLQDKMEKQ
jgi:PadR family transcriptional regulator PadR